MSLDTSNIIMNLTFILYSFFVLVRANCRKELQDGLPVYVGGVHLWEIRYEDWITQYLGLTNRNLSIITIKDENYILFFLRKIFGKFNFEICLLMFLTFSYQQSKGAVKSVKVPVVGWLTVQYYWQLEPPDLVSAPERQKLLYKLQV